MRPLLCFLTLVSLPCTAAPATAGGRSTHAYSVGGNSNSSFTYCIVDLVNVSNLLQTLTVKFYGYNEATPPASFASATAPFTNLFALSGASCGTASISSNTLTFTLQPHGFDKCDHFHTQINLSPANSPIACDVEVRVTEDRGAVLGFTSAGGVTVAGVGGFVHGLAPVPLNGGRPF